MPLHSLHCGQELLATIFIREVKNNSPQSDLWNIQSNKDTVSGWSLEKSVFVLGWQQKFEQQISQTETTAFIVESMNMLDIKKRLWSEC